MSQDVDELTLHDKRLSMNATPRHPWNGLKGPPVHLTREQDDLLAAIRRRLEDEIREDPYISEVEFAELIGVEPKTLKNDRAPSGAGRYPVGLRFGGSHRMQYVRHDVLDWLAYEELKARVCRVDRCR